MHPLTVLNLAGTIIQIVDSTSMLISCTAQISATGAKSEYVDVQEQTLGFQRLLEEVDIGIAKDTHQTSQRDNDLSELCKQGQAISKRMIKVLDGCRSNRSGGKVQFDTFWRAMKSEWHHSELQELQSQLDRISSRAVPFLVTNNHVDLVQRLSKLEELLRWLGTDRSAGLTRLQQAVEELSQSDSGIPVSLNSARRIVLDSGLAHKGHDYMIEASILSQLRFADIDRRFRQLDQRPAHKQSYSWIQHDSARGRTPSSFQSWLKSDTKFYWIAGKPGSGKSTLMKFLFQDQATRETLRSWASGNQLLLAAYFFWEIGKVPLLRTREGLLRTLLSQILKHQPDLIKIVYSNLWSLYGKGNPEGQDALPDSNWFEVPINYPDLASRMQTACQTLAASDTYLCLFIDGLDEYDGTPENIIKLLGVLTEVPNVKICASSRPENAFAEVWDKGDHRLYMETFHEADIDAYVKDTLGENRNYQDMDDEQIERADLINEIVSNAEGVFLWVHLVLQELEEGLRNGGRSEKPGHIHSTAREIARMT